MSSALSSLASFDDLRRCMQVLQDGTAEEEFLRFLHAEEKHRHECAAWSSEAERIQKELDQSLAKMSDLEGKLFHARRLIDSEAKARREAEHERNLMEQKIMAVAELLQHERHLNNETRSKLAILNTLPRKRKSGAGHREEKSCNGINSTGSLLSDLSITQSEDDFLDVRPNKKWHEHRPSIPKNAVPCVRSRRSRTSNGGVHNISATTNAMAAGTTRRSQARQSGTGAEIQQHTLNVAPGADGFCATTKVTIPQDGTGIIRAESIIESLPINQDEQYNQNGVGIVNSSTPHKAFSVANAEPALTPVHKVVSNLVTGDKDNSPLQGQRPLMRKHDLVSKTFLRGEACSHCQKRIRFGALGYRCQECPVRCHVDCRYLLTLSCVPQSSGTPNGKNSLMGYLSDFAPSSSPKIPALVVHCINEIEARGLNEMGLYRIPSTEREYKALKEQFLRGKTTPHLAKYDIHIICNCLKNFLRSLREPLIPTSQWKDFANAAQNPDSDDSLRQLYAAIEQLPQANRDTLAFLALHLQRIGQCQEVRMPVENLARIFCPTIVGNSTLDPDQQTMYTEVIIQFQVMLKLLELPSNYWNRFVRLEQTPQCSSKKSGNQVPLSANRAADNNKNIKSHDADGFYATPMKSASKKRKFFGTPPVRNK